MGLFGKSKFEKLQEQMWGLEDSDQEKKLELCNEILTHLLSQNKDENYFHIADYYMKKSRSLYRLRRYAKSLESWEKSNEYYSCEDILPTSADDLIYKSKLLNRLGKYAEALNCINLVEAHFAKYGDMSHHEILDNNRRKFDILDTINMEIPVAKIYSMHKYGSPKTEIISYLQYLHDKINFTERDGTDHQKKIAILMTNVNQWEFKSGLDAPKESIFPKDEAPAEKEESAMTIREYCEACKGHRDMKYPKEVKLKDGRPAVIGPCYVCGTNVFRMGPMPKKATPPKDEAPAEKEESIMTVQVYCEACRAKTDIQNPKEVKLQNGRPAVKGSCSVCGTNVLRMGPMPKKATPPKDEDTIRLNPNSAKAWENKGYELVEKNEKIIRDAKMKQWELYKSELYDKISEVPISLDDNDIVRRYEKALACYEKVIELSSDDVPGYYKKAEILNKLNRFEESVHFCTEAIEYFQWVERYERRELWETKIKALLELKKYGDVIFSCNMAKYDLGSINDNYYDYKYKALIELKHFEDAVECCNDVIEKYSDYTGDDFNTDKWYGYKFGALIKLKRFEEALKFCNERIDERNDPYFAVVDITKEEQEIIEILFDKCDALIKLKRFEEALECYDEISELDPSEDYVWRDQKNKLLKKLGREEETEMSNDES